MSKLILDINDEIERAPDDRARGSSSADSRDHLKTTFDETASSALLRLHEIRGLEIFSGISNERTIARMIDSFHSGNDFHHV